VKTGVVVENEIAFPNGIKNLAIAQNFAPPPTHRNQKPLLLEQPSVIVEALHHSPQQRLRGTQGQG
jgi:hypothetical protein